jgi:SdpC family antimicrobial peptide
MRSFRPLRGFALGLVCVIIACPTCFAFNSTLGQYRASRTHRQFNGEELVRGIYFGTGTVASLLPEVWQDPTIQRFLPQLHSPQTIALENRVIKRIRAAQPLFFNSFAAGMQSGNPLVVQTTLERATRELVSLVTQEAGPSVFRTNAASVGPDCEVLFIAAAAVAAFALVAYEFVYYAAAVYKPILSPVLKTDDSNRLQQEEYVALLTSRLKLVQP